ncbi:murein biosynthesis integral membrane protein MurJ [Sporosarcina aquimarina]|uniref:Probable lipid II flippase MurJ n=1 Tax=Sporosarcina aquimarina TaxID=114975 RepID=A0ABU4G2Z1_9BACL|nr:murein biosynthesis integral membrane protein MurJ [Sporosarcina aquimarina]MDW0110678.1 murein biosynthesis integral membrane protein MurJ [Sporosarcina aquimarina]
MKKAAILLMVFTILSKLLGFARDMTLANFYGISGIADAYLISRTVPIVLFGLLAAGISTAFIPMFIKIESEKGLEEANAFTNNLLSILFLIITVLVVFGLVFTEPLINAVAFGFKGETLRQAVMFTRVSILGMYFTGYVGMFSGYLQTKNNFVVPALIGIPMNLLVILSLYLSAHTNLLVLAIGTLVGTASQFVLIYFYIKKAGFRHKFNISFKDQHIKRMGLIAFPVMIGASVNQLNTIVDRTLASGVKTGGIAALAYSERINEFILGIFVLSIATVLFPVISKMVADNDLFGLKKTVSMSMVAVSFLVVPSIVGVLVLTKPIVSVLFERGEFDNEAVLLTASALTFYSIGLLSFSYQEILFRVFYSLQDTKTPMINAMITVVMNIILNIILAKNMGISGIALATSISSIACTALLARSLKKKIGTLGMKSNYPSLFKIIVASLIMGIAARSVYSLLFVQLESSYLPLLVSIAAGVVIYLVMIYFMKIEEIVAFVNTIRKRQQFR